MTIPPNTQAVLLLTSYFSKSGGDSVKPLSPKEWGRFALWLKNQDLTPEQLMGPNPIALITHWKDNRISLDRLDTLLNRGPALALALEKWLRAGLWVLSRSDSAYPARLKKLLGTDSPALLFGCGNQGLLNKGGLAVVGSRNCPEEDLQYAQRLGATIADHGYNIVSGGARGVDEAAMLGNLENEGTTVGVLADNLLRACSSMKFRRYLVDNRLALISSTFPEARFNAGNAMQRNKYIYCLSDAAMVVHTGKKGGTWNGATENLRNRWVPLWVKRANEGDSYNIELVKKGGNWVPENINEINIGDVLDGDDFSFIHPPRSISSLLLVVLFKVYAIDAYIYCTH